MKENCLFLWSIKTKKMNLAEIAQQTEQIITSLLADHPMREGSVFVIGCSSSEVNGGLIGKNSSEEIGQTIFATARKVVEAHGLFLACQCCEHLNRALVVEDACAQRYGYEPVSVVPWLHGGGSFATAAYYGFKHAVVVERVQASAGIDIGDTLIGMHLKPVAVPLHLKPGVIGQAHVVAAYCRPKLIGGERAQYKPVK